MKGIITNLY